MHSDHDDSGIPGKHKRLKAKLSNRSRSPVQLANQVTIRDILLTYFTYPDGEFRFNPDETLKNNSTLRRNESEDDLIERIYSHIAGIAQQGADIHLEANYENPAHFIPMAALIDKLEREEKHDAKAQDNEPVAADMSRYLMRIREMQVKGELAVMKSDCKNNVTRIITNEFFFYPCKERGPLTQQGFIKLLRKIEGLASNLPENMHLVLSTFPVANEFNEVNNVVVHMQSGVEPATDVFAKAIPSKVDPEYPGYNNVTFRGDVVSGSRKVNEYLYRTLDHHGYTLVREGSKSVTPDDSKSDSYIQSYGGNVTCVTTGGLVFRTTIDICMDAYKNIAKQFLKQHISDEERTLSNLIPTHVSQVVSSSSIAASFIETVTKSRLISHADSDVDELGLWQKGQRNAYVSSGVASGAQFGGDYVPRHHEPFALDQIKDEIAKDLDGHHELTIVLEAYRLLREHYPFQQAIMGRLIDKELAQYCLQGLESLPGYLIRSLSAKTIKNEVTALFADSDIMNDVDFRKNFLLLYDRLFDTYKDELTDDRVMFVLDKISMMRTLIVKDMVSISLLPDVALGVKAVEEKDHSEQAVTPVRRKF